MNKDIDDLKESSVYRAVTTVSGDLKNKLLDDCKKGEKPAQILKQALKLYYDNRDKNSY